MTISSSTRKAGPFSGTGTTGPFTFAFKVFTAADLYVVKLDTVTTVETALELTTDYTVSLNADQNAHPGGTITLISALASGYNLVITSTVDYTQETDLTNQGGFYPSVITNALDKLTILTQQLEEANLRSVKVPITSSVPATDYLTEMESIKSATTAVYGDTVAVRDATSAIYDQFNNTYLGAKATDPTLDNSGNALTAGDFYFNTTTKVFRYYSGTSWYDAMTSGVPVVDVFSGTGSQTAFALTQAPFHKNTLAVFISGVAQQHSSYSISGTTLTFTTAPPSGSSNIEVVQPGYVGVNVPVDGSVTSSKIASGVTISGPTISDPTITGTATLPSTTSIGNVSSTELGYLDGVTSAIQTQLNAKAPLASPTFTGAVALPTNTSIGNVSSTALGYVNGVTAPIQEQFEQSTLGFDFSVIANSPANSYCIASSSDGTRLIASKNPTGYIYYSNDSGATWTASSLTGLFRSIAMSSSGQYAITCSANGNLYVSSDYGATWTSKGLTGFWGGVACSSDGSRMYGVRQTGIFFSSTDYGASFAQGGTYGAAIGIACSSDGSKIVIGTAYSSGIIWSSSDYGANFTNRILIANTSINSVACSADGTKWAAIAYDASNNGSIYVSVDSGVTWVMKKTGFTASFGSVACSANFNSIFIHTIPVSAPSVFYISTDYGNTWATKTHANSAAFNNVASLPTGNKWFVAGTDGIWSADNALIKSRHASQIGTSAHGLGSMSTMSLPATPDATKYLRGDGKWTTSYLDNVTSDIQTQINSKPTGTISTAPATVTSTGTTGQVLFCADGVYVCTATNTWRKAALSTF